MHVDIVQHIIEVSSPWQWINYIQVNKLWNQTVRRMTPVISYEKAIYDCNLLAIDKERRKFALPFILAQMCANNDSNYRDVIQDMIKRGICDWNPAISAACHAGNINIVHYLFKRFTKYDWSHNWIIQNHFTINMQLALGSACQGGDMETIKYILKWLRKMRKRSKYYKHPANLCIQWRSIFNKACQGGCYDVIEMICPYISRGDIIHGLQGAYIGGHLTIICLIESLGYSPDYICLLNAIKSGNPDVVKHIATAIDITCVDRTIVPPALAMHVSNMPSVRLIDIPTDVKFYDACKSGSLEQVIYYEDILKKDASSYKNLIKKGLMYACQSGQREIMNYFIKQDIPCLCSKSVKYHIKYIEFKKYQMV